MIRNLLKLMGAAIVTCLGIAIIAVMLGDGSTSSEKRKPFTPMPTAIPEQAPTCQEIMTTKDGITDAQKQAYLKNQHGKQLDWSGTIKDVSEGGLGLFNSGYTIRVEISGGCDLLFTFTDEERALAFVKGQRVTVDGTIDSFEQIFGLTIYLKDDPTLSTE